MNMPIDAITRQKLIVQQTVATNLLEIIGNGIDFPFRYTVDQKIGTIQESNAGERIKDSIHLILATRIGERPFNPEYGSRLPELVFEPMDDALKELLRYYTVDALSRWEKRIEIQQVNLEDHFSGDPNTIGISIYYTIRNSHIRGSYVYPFTLGGMNTENQYTGSESGRMLSKAEVRT
jgi:phage baseplate assembly protein W